MRRIHHLLTLCLTTSLFSAAALSAQNSSQTPSGRASFGATVQVSSPRGDFAQNTGTGFGFGGSALFSLDRRKLLNLRADVSGVLYADERRQVPFANTGGLIQLNLRTSSTIGSFLVGPQLMGPTGVFTPYATALAGGSVFSTESTIEGSNNVVPFANTNNANDFAWAYGGALGAYLRVREGRHPVRADVGARFLRHEDATYLTPVRVRQAFETNSPPVPVRGRADFVSYYVGFNIISF